MLKQLFTAAALVATTATAGLAQGEMKQAGFDFYHGNANGCGYNVLLQEKDSVGDIHAKLSILCGEYDYGTHTYERETRLRVWVRCQANGNDWIARRNSDGSGTPWEAVEGPMTRQVVDAVCGRIGDPTLRSF